MTGNAFDVIVVGGGIAGAAVAAHLAADRRVAVLEAEETAGYHTTGRSAALWVQNYGPPDVRLLTRLSRSFFEAPPPGFADHPLWAPRSSVILARPGEDARFEALLAAGIGLREIPVATLCERVPALRPGIIVRAAIEEDAFDMDVAALHQGFLRQARASGAIIALRSRTAGIARRGGTWQVDTADAVFQAPVLVDCAGAWGDEVARQAGAPPLGLVPKRRTGAIIDPAPWEVARWPMINDLAETWYARPEARTRLMVSPADQTPMYAHDVQPDELDVAVAIDRMQAILDIPVRRVERAWAGLRTFTPDGSLAFGWDPAQEGFFWCVGQGGYGIQTSPAAGRLVADLIAGRDPGEAGRIVASIAPGRFARAAA